MTDKTTTEDILKSLKRKKFIDKWSFVFILGGLFSLLIIFKVTEYYAESFGINQLYLSSGYIFASVVCLIIVLIYLKNNSSRFEICELKYSDTDDQESKGYPRYCLVEYTSQHGEKNHAILDNVDDLLLLGAKVEDIMLQRTAIRSLDLEINKLPARATIQFNYNITVSGIQRILHLDKFTYPMGEFEEMIYDELFKRLFPDVKVGTLAEAVDQIESGLRQNESSLINSDLELKSLEVKTVIFI